MKKLLIMLTSIIVPCNSMQKPYKAAAGAMRVEEIIHNDKTYYIQERTLINDELFMEMAKNDVTRVIPILHLLLYFVTRRNVLLVKMELSDSKKTIFEFAHRIAEQAKAYRVTEVIKYSEQLKQAVIDVINSGEFGWTDVVIEKTIKDMEEDRDLCNYVTLFKRFKEEVKKS